jgi:asparagine synthase (glutamine-hydrolysing)
MSVQFGRWNLEGQAPAAEYVEKVSAILAPHGPDSDEAYSKGGVKILYRAFHTTKESRRETQPHVSASGTVITWDGRLDNRAELIGELRDSLTISSTDVAIVAAAVERWRDKSLGRLIGDWALSIWNPGDPSLILAKDPVGTRHLYYSFEKDHVTWSTILDPLVLFAGRTFSICEEYIAGRFSHFPAAHLTPYVGVHAVPPCSFVLLRPLKDGIERTISKYWDFDPGKRIRYRSDAEYEEHFRGVLATAVRRRLRSDRPVLAELSGGMDSSSIVCISDIVIGRNQAECPRLDTISWYDDSYDHIEPDWNERPFFTKVEETRGRAGYHIDLSSLNDTNARERFETDYDGDRFAATPIPNKAFDEFAEQYAAYFRSHGYCVTLSGVGGDELTGSGVPTPKPELQNLAARGRFVTLAHQLRVWAAKMREPRLPLLWEAVRSFLPLELVRAARDRHLAPWLDAGFVHRNRAALYAYPSRVRLFGPLPSFQDHIDKLKVNQRFLAYFHLQPEFPREIRFPYFDRDLLEFMYAIPREQIVRVGQRRSLMKRALVGIVPNEILYRRRMPLVLQRSMKNDSTNWPTLLEMGQHFVSTSIGIIDSDRFTESLRKAPHDEEVPLDILRRTLELESWLRHLTIQGVLTNSTPTKRQDYSLSMEAKELQTRAQRNSSAS